MGAAFINDTGRTVVACDDLIELKDYDELIRRCDKLGYRYSDVMEPKAEQTSDILEQPRRVVAFHMTFRSDGYYLLRGRALTEGSYNNLCHVLASFDPYDNKLFKNDEL